jgi:hypothetical protein
MRRNYFLTSILILCTWLNALPVAAQSKSAKPATGIQISGPVSTDPSVVFGSLRRQGGDAIFSEQLTKMNGGDADPADALAAQSIYFFEQIREQANGQLSETVEKAKEAAKKRYEELKAKQGPAKAGPVKPIPPPRKTATVKYDETPGRSDVHVFRSAAYSPEDGALQIKTNKRENGADVSGSETKTIDTPAATVTRGAEGKSDITFDGKQFSTSISMTEKDEAASKTDNRKLGITTKIEWSGAFDVCPDAEGIVRGEGKARLYNQTTIHTGRDLGALTSDTVIEVKFTGHVNDAAEMTHFDLEGTTTETMLGYDRALDHGIIDDNKGIEDGKSTVTFERKNNTPPAGDSPSGDIAYGPWKMLTYDQLSDTTQRRMGEFLAHGFNGIMLEVGPLISLSIKRWQGGECVDVECVPAKPALKAGETVEVTATANSKQDLSKINGDQKAFGTQSVTPEEQRGEPSAVYTLTAPKAGEKAYISVTSTSKRGIGSGTWEYAIPKPKRKPPVKAPPPPKHVDPIWTGSINAVHTEKEENEKPPSGRMKYEKTVKSHRWEVVLAVDGTRDLSGGIINNFYAETDVMYTARDYRETAYAPGKMSCGNGPIITSPETRKYEMIDNGVGHQRLVVTISVIGTQGYLSFNAPGINADRSFIVKYETNCAPYNATNSKTYPEPRGVSVGSPGFEVDFVVDPAKPNEVQGTKTVTNSDGSQTVYSWHLTRGK